MFGISQPLAALGAATVAAATAFIGAPAEAPVSTAAATPAAVDDVSPFIVGGEPAQEAPPGIAAVYVNGKYKCTGVLVKPRLVVTAGHCLSTEDPAAAPPAVDTFTLNIGSTDRTAGEWVEVDSIDTHPEWDFGTGPAPMGDIGRLKLKHPMWTKPALIAREGAKPGEAVKLFGWGLTQMPPSDPPIGLNTATLPVVNPEACTGAEIPPQMWITDGEMCTGHPGGVGACYGDSGGPIFSATGRLVAIASRGYGPCGQTVSANTSVPHYRSYALGAFQ